MRLRSVLALGERFESPTVNEKIQPFFLTTVGFLTPSLVVWSAVVRVQDDAAGRRRRPLGTLRRSDRSRGLTELDDLGGGRARHER